MRLAIVTRVLNEADIIEAFVRHCAAFGVHHFIADNGSTDSTVEILRSLHEEGLPLTVTQYRSVAFNESDTMTNLYHQAMREAAPDWVMCIDCDEFIDDRKLPGGLNAFLDWLPNPPDYLNFRMVSYVATSADNAAERVVPLRMTKRRDYEDNYKIIVRARPDWQDVRIDNGSHSAQHHGARLESRNVEALFLAHYAERSAWQYIAKFVRGWCKVLASGETEVKNRTAYHYRTPYEYLLNDPRSLLRNGHFLGFKNESPDLIDDPIAYRGGPLRYTPQNDEQMRAARSLMGYLNELALRHGRLMDEFPFVQAAVQEWESESKRLF